MKKMKLILLTIIIKIGLTEQEETLIKIEADQEQIQEHKVVQRGGQRAGSNNRQGPPRPEVDNPVMQRLMQYVREQGVSGKNIRDVMSVIMQIGREYKSSNERGSYKPSDESVSKLKDAGLNDETVEAVIEVIKALAVYDK